MENPTSVTSGAQPSPKEGQAVASNEVGFLYIRVRRDIFHPTPTSPMHSSPQPVVEGHLYLLEGSFTDIVRYAGTTAGWIIRLAHLLCDPLDTGQVFTHTTGTSSDWYALEREASWRQVLQDDPLLPGIYEFVPNHAIELSKISERINHSLTTPGSESSSLTFRRQITLRDSMCVVTGSVYPKIASHLIPKRIGSDGAKAVVTRFVGANEATNIHRYDARIGILLSLSLNSMVDRYQLGFYHVRDNVYSLHNFNTDVPDLSYLGMALPNLQNSLPQLHGHEVTLGANAGDLPLPPQGVFNWHYMQCVINRFGTPQYKGVPNIKFFTFPFKTASDSSGSECIDDDDGNPPYPSYNFDRYLEEQSRRHWALERHKNVTQWASGVIPCGHLP